MTSATYLHNQANDIIHLLSAVQALRENTCSQSYLRNYVCVLQLESKTIGPESVDALVVCFLGQVIYSKKFKSIEEGKQCALLLINAIGKNNLMYADTTGGNMLNSNHVGELYNKKEIDYLNSKIKKINNPQQIMNKICFTVNAAGEVEISIKDTWFELCRKKVEKCLFG